MKRVGVGTVGIGVRNSDDAGNGSPSQGKDAIVSGCADDENSKLCWSGEVYFPFTYKTPSPRSMLVTIFRLRFICTSRKRNTGMIATLRSEIMLTTDASLERMLIELLLAIDHLRNPATCVWRTS